MEKRLSQNETALFLCLQKNRASPNFAQSELARLPNFLYLRESSQDIPKIMFKSYTCLLYTSFEQQTSSNTICAGACTGLGIGPNKIGNVYGLSLIHIYRWMYNF